MAGDGGNSKFPSVICNTLRNVYFASFVFIFVFVGGATLECHFNGALVVVDDVVEYSIGFESCGETPALPANVIVDGGV